MILVNEKQGVRSELNIVSRARMHWPKERDGTDRERGTTSTEDRLLGDKNTKASRFASFYEVKG
jgi:hypothetical protein